MLRRILVLPFKIVRGLVRAVRDGGRDQPFPDAGREVGSPAAPRASAPAVEPEGQGEPSHHHGHSHDPAPEPSREHGHSHDHTPESGRDPAPEPSHHHGHSHDHGHDHGRSGGVSVSFEGTPNPNAMKFMLNCPAVAAGSLSFTSAEEAAGNALGERLFGIPGVVSIFAVNDFVTVTKETTVSWGRLTHPIVEALEELYG